jgi:hypothetical protein
MAGGQMKLREYYGDVDWQVKRLRLEDSDVERQNGGPLSSQSDGRQEGEVKELHERLVEQRKFIRKLQEDKLQLEEQLRAEKEGRKGADHQCHWTTMQNRSLNEKVYVSLSPASFYRVAAWTVCCMRMYVRGIEKGGGRSKFNFFF